MAQDLSAMTEDEIRSNLTSLNSIMSEITTVRDSVRAAINKRNRPKPLEILDLPEELLTRIFEYVRGEKSVYEKDLYFFDFARTSTASIQQVRLTCRRFYETSSHLLLDYIPVCLTRQSLARLDEVSRHPFLSKGVRAIKLSLVPFYDAVLASDIHAFAAYQASKLWEDVDRWEMFKSNVNLAPPNLSEDAITKANSLAQSWDEVAAQGVDTTDADHILLTRAYEEYGKRYRDHKEMCESLAQGIACAMMRMPTASWLNTDGYDSWREYISCFLPNDLDTPDSLMEKLVMPLGGLLGWGDAQKYGLEPPPFNLISDLLLSIQQLGVTLKGLDLGTPPPADGISIVQTTQEESELHAAVRQLKAIQFHPRNNIWSREWTERPAEEWKPFIKFLTHLLHTESLQKIDLSFYFMGHDDPQPLLSMATLLLSFTWPNLKILHFNGPFYFEELQSVVKRLDKKVRLQWSGFLMSGSWAQVLDFLKQQKFNSIEVGDVNQSIYGQECDEMTTEERKAIFYEDRLKSRWNTGSLATQYVRRWRESNPVKDWENGTLEIPEPEGEDI